MTLGLRPPDGAVVLFNGRDLGNWCRRDGGAAEWQVEDGVMTVAPGTGDILSGEQFGDVYLHLEFACPDMPEATGQAKANSGVFLQGRYEIQVLDSVGWAAPGKGDCGAVYDQFAPLVNACKPALEWQTYDVVFRAARVDAQGDVLENARVTMVHNGRVVHNNVVLRGPTGGAIDHNVGEPGPLLLQDHGNLLRYRNLWIVHLPEKGSGTYEPR